MPDLEARVVSRRATARFDEFTVDVLQRGPGADADRVVYLPGHKVRVPKYARDVDVIAVLAAEMTRLRLLAEPDDAEGAPGRISQTLTDVRPSWDALVERVPMTERDRLEVRP